MASPFRYGKADLKLKDSWDSSQLKVYLHKLVAIVIEYSKVIAKWSDHNRHIIFSFAIAVLSLIIMLVSAYPVNVRMVLFGLGFEVESIVRYIFLNLNLILFGSILLSYIFSNNNLKNKFVSVIVGLVVQFSLLAYFFSIAQNSYYLIAIPVLTLLIYNAHYYLLSNQLLPYFEVLIYVILFALQAFSLQEFLAGVSITPVQIDINYLQNPILYNSLTWLVIGILSITVLTLHHLRPDSWQQGSIFFGLIFFIFFQVGWFLYNIRFNNFIYWQQMMAFVIIWDFLYMPFKMIMDQIKDDRYTARFAVYSIYHILLLIVVMLSPFYL